MSNVNAWEQLCAAVEELEASLYAMLDAKTIGDTALVQKHAEQVASLRQAIKASQAAVTHASPVGIQHDLIKRTRNALDRIKQAETALAQTPNIDPAALSYVIESILEDNWDAERDLVVLVGDERAYTYALAIRARGQRRIFIYRNTSRFPQMKPPQDIPIATTQKELIDAIEVMPGDPSSRATVQRIPQTDISKEDLDTIAHTVDLCLRSQSSRRATIEHFGDLWVRQGLRNLPSLAQWPSVFALKNTFFDQPALIVGPGPSLSKNINQLQSVRGRALIIALHRTLKALSATGLIPDIVLVTDPQDWRSHFEGFPVDQIGAVILGATVNPDLFHLPAPRYFRIAGNGSSDEWISDIFSDTQRIAATASVACTAFDVALLLGCNPIVMTGLDLAFSNDQYYADGAADGQITIEVDRTNKKKYFARSNLPGVPDREHHTLTTVDGLDGSPIRTSPQMKQFHSWFEAACQDVEDRIVVLNCTEGGAFIRGMRHIPLSKAIEEHITNEEINADHVFDHAIQLHPRDSCLLSAQKSVNQFREALTQSTQDAELCLKRISDARDNKQHAVKQLSRTEQQLVTHLRSLSFLSLMRQRAIQRASSGSSQANTNEEQFNFSEQLYSVVFEACLSLGHTLDEIASELALMIRDGIGHHKARSIRQEHSWISITSSDLLDQFKIPPNTMVTIIAQTICRLIDNELRPHQRKRLILAGRNHLIGPALARIDDAALPIKHLPLDADQCIREIGQEGFVAVVQTDLSAQDWLHLRKLFMERPMQSTSLWRYAAADIMASFTDIHPSRFDFPPPRQIAILRGDQTSEGVLHALRRYDSFYPVNGKCVIELGPLEGYHSAELIRLGAKGVTSVDIRPENGIKMLWAKSMFSWDKISFVFDDLHALVPQKEGPFDICCALGVYYHSPAPFIALQSIASLADVIYFGGISVEADKHMQLTTLHDADQQQYRAYRWQELDYCTMGVSDHGYFFTPDDLRKWFERSGFSVKNFRSDRFNGADVPGRRGSDLVKAYWRWTSFIAQR